MAESIAKTLVSRVDRNMGSVNFADYLKAEAAEIDAVAIKNKQYKHMSTCNFSYENILVAIEDEDVGIFEDSNRKGLQEELQEAIPSGNISNEWCKGDMYNRNYGGRELFVVNIYHDTKKCGGVYKQITVLYRGGYYSGLNIDYHISEEVDCNYNNCKPSKTLDKKVSILCNKIKKIITSYGTPLRRVAVFSNGEAIYEKV